MTCPMVAGTYRVDHLAAIERAYLMFTYYAHLSESVKRVECFWRVRR